MQELKSAGTQYTSMMCINRVRPLQPSLKRYIDISDLNCASLSHYKYSIQIGSLSFIK